MGQWRWPVLLGVAGWLAVVLTCGSTLTLGIPTLSAPGLTCDEPFSILYGWKFVQRLHERGWEFFEPRSIAQVFAGKSEHPPLGRFFIGWTCWLQSAVADRSSPAVPQDARLAPATAFAIMIVLVCRFAAKHYGPVAGITAGVSLVLMPRLFAHAHFAALDTLVAWTYLMSVLSAGWMMAGRRPGLRAVAAGALLGCALLTKIHGLLLLPVVTGWGLWYYRRQAVLPLAIWLATGVVIFIGGWPWLWSDVAGLWEAARSGLLFQADWARTVRLAMPRLTQFLGSSLARETIHVAYLGGIYRDAEVPWHYPWVLFGVTVPVGLHLLGLAGFGRQVGRLSADASGALIVTAMLFPLCLFSLPGIPVYDGVRLFLMVFPLWGIMIGRGAGMVWEWAGRWRARRWAGWALAALLVSQGYGLWHYHPFQLSYYNCLVGGLSGAAKRGFQVTYWGDTLTTSFLNRWSELAGHNRRAVVVPNMYPSHTTMYQTPAMDRREQRIVTSLKTTYDFMIVYHREAYLPPEVREVIRRREPVLKIERDGVWLSAVYAVKRRTASL